MFDVAGVVIGSTFLVATAAFTWKLFSAYLKHRETMKRLDVGGDGAAPANQA